MDWLTFHAVVKVIAGLLVIGFLAVFARLLSSATNELEWSDLLSVPDRNGGRARADWNQIGKGLGVVLCVWLPAVYVYSSKMDATGLAAIMGVALLYLGSVSGYAATLRSRQAGTTTTVVSEPALEQPPQKVTTTTTEPAKLAGG